MRKLNKIVFWIIAFLIGYLVLSILSDFLIIAVQLLDLGFLVLPSFLTLKVYGLPILTLILSFFGGVYGILSYQRKNIFYRILRPSKAILSLNSVVSIIATVTLILIRFKFSLISIVFDVVGFYMLSYPFSSLLHYVYKNFKSIHPKLIILLILLLINPLALNYLGNLNQQLLQSQLNKSEKCGLIISGLEENSPLIGKDVIDRKIDSINGVKIDNMLILTNMLNSINSSQEVRLIVDNKTVEVKPSYDGASNLYSLGLIIDQIPCRT